MHLRIHLLVTSTRMGFALPAANQTNSAEAPTRAPEFCEGEHRRWQQIEFIKPDIYDMQLNKTMRSGSSKLSRTLEGKTAKTNWFAPATNSAIKYDCHHETHLGKAKIKHW